MVRSNRTVGGTAVAVRPGAPSLVSGNRCLGSSVEPLAPPQAERLGEHRPEPGVLAAERRDELERVPGRPLERPAAVLERVVDQPGRAAVVDQLAAHERAPLEARAAERDPLILEAPADGRLPGPRAAPRG